MLFAGNLGVIGGTGQLGRAIVQGLIDSGLLVPGQVWISNRSGDRSALKGLGEVNFTSCNQTLADNCATIILSVPPAFAASMKLKFGDQLVMSVMAGITIEKIIRLTGARRVIRAMSSPAAAQRMAYSPYCAGPGVTASDRETAQAIFAALGLSDEVDTQDQIDRFTVLTGPVPGFVAFFAECLSDYAQDAGIDPKIADRAVRQLFLASGNEMSLSDLTPAEQVAAMVDYAGTTAAGLTQLQASSIKSTLHKGLDKAYQKTKSIGQ